MAVCFLIHIKLTLQFLTYILVAYCQIKGELGRKMLFKYNGISEVLNREKMIVLTFKDSEEKIFQRAVSLLDDELQIEYGTFVFIAYSPNRVFRKSQMFHSPIF